MYPVKTGRIFFSNDELYLQGVEEGIQFAIKPANIEEKSCYKNPAKIVADLAKKKAEAVWQFHQ